MLSPWEGCRKVANSAALTFDQRVYRVFIRRTLANRDAPATWRWRAHVLVQYNPTLYTTRHASEARAKTQAAGGHLRGFYRGKIFIATRNTQFTCTREHHTLAPGGAWSIK